MRTIRELERAALTLRARLLNDGEDPLDGVFHVTVEESMLLLMQPYPGNGTLNHERNRLCGLKVETV